MAAKRDAKKFVQLLAAKLSKDECTLDNDDLEEYFRGCLETLPRTELKTTVEDNFPTYLKQLLRVVSTSNKKSPKIPEKRKGNAHSSEKFNLFGIGAVDKVLKSAAQKPLEERTTIYDHLWACYPSAHVSEKLFSILSSSEAKDGDDKSFEDTLQAISKCKQVTFGCRSKQSVGDCMKFFLSELTPWCEECMRQPISEERKQRALELKRSIHDIVALMQFRWNDCDNDATRIQSRDVYWDPMAALLSLYIDLVLLTENEKTDDSSAAKEAGNLVLHILGPSPIHCMDVLLQSSAIASENILSMTPVIRSVLRRNTRNLTNCTYIKCVLLARSCLVKGGDSQDIVSIRQTVDELPARPRFVSWLSEQDERLREKLGLHRKMTGTQVTRHLLECENDEPLECLLDLACDAAGEEVVVSTKEVKQLNSVDSESQNVDELLFFVDAHGEADVDMPSQVIEYEENSREEKILHKQLRSLFGHMTRDSDSEDENYCEDLNIETLPAKVFQPSFDAVQASREGLINESTADIEPDLAAKQKTTDLPQVEVIDEERIETLKVHNIDESGRVQTRKSKGKNHSQTKTTGDSKDSHGESSELTIEVVNDQEINLVRRRSQQAEGTNNDVCTMEKDVNLMEIEVVDDMNVDMVIGTSQEEKDSACHTRIKEKKVRKASCKKMGIRVVDERDVNVVAVRNSQEDEVAAKKQNSKQHLQRSRNPKTRKKKGTGLTRKKAKKT